MATIERKSMAVIVCGAMIVLAASAVAPAAGPEPTSGRVPDASAWRQAATTGSELTIPLADRSITMRVAEDVGLFAPGRRPPGVLPLRGTLPGGGWVRAAIAEGIVVALAWSPQTGLVSVGPSTHGGLAAVADAAATVRARGVDTVIEPAQTEATETCDSLVWQPQLASPTSLLEEDPLRTFNVAVAVDSSYATAIPGWQAAATAAIGAVDELYRSSFQIRISMVHLIQIPDDEVPGATTGEMLASLQGYYVQHHGSLERENVHLFTGRAPTNAAGQVNCVGSVGRTTVSYSVSEGIPGGPYVFPGGLVLLPDGAMKIAAHELAHTLSAHHHYANCVEPAPTFDPFITMDLCTVMINDWGLIAPVFSSLEKLTVRGWAEYYDV